MIQTIIYSAHLEMDRDSADWNTLRSEVEAALTARYPDAELRVEVRHNVSGAGAGTIAYDESGCDDYRENEQARAIVDRAVEAWLQRQ